MSISEPMRQTRAGAWGFKPRHLVILLVFLAVFFPGLYLFAIKSDAYEYAEYFARTNPEIAKQCAPLEVEFRFWEGFHITYSGGDGEANFVLNLRGQKQEVCTLDIRLRRAADLWRVDNAYLATKGGKAIQIKSTMPE